MLDKWEWAFHQAGEEVLARNQATQAECGASTVMLDQARIVQVNGKLRVNLKRCFDVKVKVNVTVKVRIQMKVNITVKAKLCTG